MASFRGKSGLEMRVTIEGLPGVRWGRSERFITTADYVEFLERLWHRKVTVLSSRPVFW